MFGYHYLKTNSAGGVLKSDNDSLLHFGDAPPFYIEQIIIATGRSHVDDYEKDIKSARQRNS